MNNYDFKECRRLEYEYNKRLCENLKIIPVPYGIDKILEYKSLYGKLSHNAKGDLMTTDTQETTITTEPAFLTAHKESIEHKINFYLQEIKTLKKTLRKITKLQQKNEDFLTLIKTIATVTPETIEQ